MTKLDQQIKELEAYRLLKDQENQLISNGSLYWHIAHNLLVIQQVMVALPLSNPKDFKNKISFYKTIVFLTKKIPRGKVKAPRLVRPEVQDIETINKQFIVVNEHLQNLDSIDKNQYFEHPFFGDIKKKDAIVFLEIHTEHHLKIIRDILNKA